MKEVLLFCYQYYRIFAYIFTAFIGLMLLYLLFVCKHTNSIWKRAIYLTLALAVCAIISFAVNRWRLNNQEITIKPIQNGRITLLEADSSFLSYYTNLSSDERWRYNRGKGYTLQYNGEENVELVVRVPLGFERKLIFASGPDCGAVCVNEDGVEKDYDLVSDTAGTLSIQLTDTPSRILLLLFAEKLLVCAILSIVLCALTGVIIILPDYNRLFGILAKGKYGIAVFAYLSVNLFVNAPDCVNAWSVSTYAGNYTMGVAPRFFIGSLFRLFDKDYLKESSVYHFCFFSYLIIILIFSFIVNEVIIKADESIRATVIFLIAMYLCCPGSLESLWHAHNFGRFEMYNFLLLLLMVIIIFRVRNAIVKISALSVLMLINVAIYQGFVFQYFPPVFFLLVLVWARSEKRLKDKLELVIPMIACAGAFLFFQFHRDIHFSTYEEMKAYLSSRTDIMLPPLRGALDYEHFYSLPEAYEIITLDFLKGYEYPRQHALITFFLLVPVFLTLCVLWMKSARSGSYNEKKKRIESPGFIFVLGLLPFIPLFALEVDWGRWMAALIFYCFFAVLVLAYTGSFSMRCAFVWFGEFIRKHVLLAAITLIYLASLETIGSRIFISQANNVWRFITDHFLR